MGSIHLQPSDADWLRLCGLRSVASVFDLRAILVNLHRRRQVEWVSLNHETSDGPQDYYLKKEYAVTWRDRFRNAWHGFGWCATAVREAKLLLALREADIGCPDVAAFGEEGGRAFVLLRDESGMSELRRLLPTLTCARQRRRLAEDLGSELARMHAAGFEHPDLFAKHILAAGSSGRFCFCIIDWQRGRRSAHVSWRARCRDLAALDATLHAALASDRLRLRCLRAYHRATVDAPPLSRLARRIRREAAALLSRRNLREIAQLPIPPKTQQFVQLQSGRLFVVRSYYEELGGRLPESLSGLTHSRPNASEEARVDLRGRSSADLNTWELPTLAHTLFRLHRFGVPAPRLLAVSPGRMLTTDEKSIPLAEALDTADAPTHAALIEQAEAIVRKVHDAGYRLPVHEYWVQHLGVAEVTGNVMLMNVEILEEDRTTSRPRTDDNRQMRFHPPGQKRQAVP